MNESVNLIVKALKNQEKKPTYDNIHYMLKAIVMFISGQSRGMDYEYLDLADGITEKGLFTEKELKEMTRMRINRSKSKEKINEITTNVTNRVIDALARKRRVNIKVNSKWFDNLQEIRVVHEDNKANRIYRWNPEDKDTLSRIIIRPSIFPEIGEYVNLTEFCLALEKSITERYPNPEDINFVHKTYNSTTRLIDMPRYLVNRFSRKAIRYGVGSEYPNESLYSDIYYIMCSREQLRRDKKGLAFGLYVKRKDLEDYLSNYKIAVSGYSKPEDKPKQKKK